MSNESLKPRNDRFSIDHKHLARELREANIWPPETVREQVREEIPWELIMSAIFCNCLEEKIDGILEEK